MITNRNAKLHVCLRCQRILKNWQLPFMSTFCSIKISNHPKNRCKSAVARVCIEDNTNEHRVFELKKPNDKDTPLYGNSFNKKVESVEQVKGKNGKTANIIVLRDSLLSTYRSKPKQATPKNAPRLDILGQLGNETGLANTNEVIKNIDDLRPEEEQLDSWAEFNKLVDDLVNGFTTIQLEQYFDKFHCNIDNIDTSEITTYDCKDLISSITPWRPDISTSHKYFDNDPYRGYLLESRTLKQRLAIRLIRECWNVELLPLMEGVGQFEIQIRADIFEVLLSGKPLPLQTFYDEVLTIDGEGLEVFWSRNVIRFTTTRARKYRISQEIEKLVKRIKILKLSLGDLMPVFDDKHGTELRFDQWIRKTFNDQTLAELKQLTGVTIRRETNGKISLGAIEDGSGFLEGPVDAARRLLLTARQPNYFGEHSLASADISLAAPINYCQVDGLNWWGKTRTWYRWTNPIHKATESSRKVPTKESSFINFIHDKSGNKKNETVMKFSPVSQPAKKSTSETLWSTKYSTSTFATMGALIHSHLDSKSREPPLLSSDFEDLITEFSSHVPNITRLLSLAKFKKTCGYDEEAIIRFLPNPFLKSRGKYRKRRSSSKTSSLLPIVEFHCSINREKKAHFSYADAIIHKNYTDIMLPEESVDVRFHQRTTSRLLDKKLPAITRFFQKSTLDLNPGGNISIPPSIILPIPTNLCTSMTSDSTQLSLDLDDKKIPGCQNRDKEVEFIFSNFEIRRKLIFKYESWHLEYVYIDAGKSGGMRGELSLRPIKDDKGVGDQEFIDFGLELACRITSLSTPDMTKFPHFSKIERTKIRKYIPLDESKSDYPRSFLYIPRRISSLSVLDKSLTTEDSVTGLLPDFEEEVMEYEDELDDFTSEN